MEFVAAPSSDPFNYAVIVVSTAQELRATECRSGILGQSQRLGIIHADAAGSQRIYDRPVINRSIVLGFIWRYNQRARQHRRFVFAEVGMRRPGQEYLF